MKSPTKGNVVVSKNFFWVVSSLKTLEKENRCEISLPARVLFLNANDSFGAFIKTTVRLSFWTQFWSSFASISSLLKGRIRKWTFIFSRPELELSVDVFCFVATSNSSKRFLRISASLSPTTMGAIWPSSGSSSPSEIQLCCCSAIFQIPQEIRNENLGNERRNILKLGRSRQTFELATRWFHFALIGSSDISAGHTEPTDW